MIAVCSLCVAEPFLRARIEQEGISTVCDFCHATDRQSICIEKLAEWVHEVLSEHFIITSPEPEGIDYLLAKEGRWEQPGAPVAIVIADIAQLDEGLADAVRDYLSDQHDDHGSDGMVELQPYDDDTHYEALPVETAAFEDTWQSFRQEIQTRARFFNQSAKESLDSLFKDIGDFSTRHGSVIRTLTPEDCIVRGRLATSMAEMVEIIKEAPRSLGAPSYDNARAGRMNAEGIPVFYGALSIATCVAELRAPVGSLVISGVFRPVRELRVLDLTRLGDAYRSSSFFDPDEQRTASRLAFLRQLEGELNIPVMPGAEARDYLPTQAVSEYIASADGLNLDGLMFTSSQIARKMTEQFWPHERDEANKNIVLFSHACVLEHHELLPPHRIAVDCHENPPPYDDEYEIEIVEYAPDTGLKAHDAADPGNGGAEQPRAYGLPTLSLDMASIDVQKIEGISFDMSHRPVYRHRYEDEDPEF